MRYGNFSSEDDRRLREMRARYRHLRVMMIETVRTFLIPVGAGLAVTFLVAQFYSIARRRDSLASSLPLNEVWRSDIMDVRQTLSGLSAEQTALRKTLHEF